MENQVLADIVPFLPSILKKVPWYVRAALLVALIVASLYIFGSWLWGWPASHNLLLLDATLAPFAGIPAVANVPVGKKAAITGDLELMGQALAHAFSQAPAPVVHLYADVESLFNKIKSHFPGANVVAQDVTGAVESAVTATAPAASPAAADAAALAAKRSAAAKKGVATRKANAAAKAAAAAAVKPAAKP